MCSQQSHGYLPSKMKVILESFWEIRFVSRCPSKPWATNSWAKSQSISPEEKKIDVVCDFERTLNWLAVLAFGSNSASLLGAVCSVTVEAVSVMLEGIHPVNLSHRRSEWYSKDQTAYACEHLCAEARTRTLTGLYRCDCLHLVCECFFSILLTKHAMLSSWCFL